MTDKADFRPVADSAALDELMQASYQAPVVLFLDDPYCPISERAHLEVSRVPVVVAQVDVSEQHTLSREIARRTGVRHESPQLFVLRDGQPAWSGSHGRITATAVQAALAESA